MRTADMTTSAGVIRLGILAALIAVTAPPSRLAAQPEIGIEEKLGQTLPLDAVVYDESGTSVRLRDLVTRPTIVTFVYYRCPGICSPLLTEVSRIVDKMDLVPGTDYRILTLSFDHRETPDLSASKKASYLGALKKPIDPAAWRFLTADSATVMQVTGGAGFYFKKEGEDFVHVGALIVLSPEGKITRYLNGITYLPFDVKMALIEASDGKVGPTIAKLLKFCYAYDPEARTYAMSFTRVGGVVTLVLAAAFVLFLLLRPRKKSPAGNVTYGESQ